MARRERRTGQDAYIPGNLLDWTDHTHWARTEKPCRYCGESTQLRDSRRAPAHKTCAEAALTERAAEAADALQIGT
ncbi:hypothetical protein ACWD2L_00355 [Streptomyces sp. NPDC002754]